jgi:hypothetical protein
VFELVFEERFELALLERFELVPLDWFALVLLDRLDAVADPPRMSLADLSEAWATTGACVARSRISVAAASPPLPIRIPVATPVNRVRLLMIRPPQWMRLMEVTTPFRAYSRGCRRFAMFSRRPRSASGPFGRKGHCPIT